MKRTLIILSFVILAIGLGVGYLVGIFHCQWLREQKPWLQLGEPKPWPQEEIRHFELLVSPDGEKSPTIGWNDGKGGIMFLHDVALRGPIKDRGWSITFALYDRECLLGDPRRIFLTDRGRFAVCEVKETQTVQWNLSRPEIIEMWGERWQILRVIQRIMPLDGNWPIGVHWEIEYLVIMRWIR